MAVEILPRRLTADVLMGYPDVFAGRRAGPRTMSIGKVAGMDLFMTGYPGFIAQRLLPCLLESGRFQRAFLLVEERFRSDAQKLTASLKGGEVRLLVGDITRPNLDLSPEMIQELRADSEWWHLAAAYRLDIPEPIARRVNVEGTRNVLDLARQIGPERLNYVSTAYVSGWTTGRVLESDLPEARPENFKNFYELTKNEAEWLVRGQMSTLPITIYRYGVVTGDSTTGATAKFDGPFLTIKYVDNWGRFPLPRIGPMEASINIVPVDFVVKASAFISAQPEAAGRCFQLVDPQPLKAGEFFEAVAEALGRRLPRWSMPARMMDWLMHFGWMRRTIEIPREAMLYINHRVDYDCTEAQAILEGSGIQCPAATSYIPTLVRFYHENRHRAELHIRVD